MTTPDLTLYSGFAPNPMVVILFVKERCPSLPITIRNLDILNSENRKPPYRTQINPRGTLPALQVRSTRTSNFILTEITAICEYLDEIADSSSPSLYGTTPLERAETRMHIRRLDLELATPVHEYYRNDPATVDFYRGWRTPVPEAQLSQKVSINQALNRLDEGLESDGRPWLCGERFSAADVFLFGMLALMKEPVPWVWTGARAGFSRWWERMESRGSVDKVMRQLYGRDE